MPSDVERSTAAARRVALAPFLLEESESETSSSSSDSSSEDSSSDDDWMDGAYERAFDVFFRLPAKRPKVAGFVETVVRQYSDAEFRRHFRMSRAAASKLILGFAASPLCPSSGHGGVPAKSAECHILTFIWYAANKTSMRAVGSRFDLSESSVHRILLRVANYIVSLGPTTLTFPTDLEKLSKDFETVSGVPGVIGCIDGSYINIQCPKKKIPSTYCNRHQTLSMTLQAVCDHKRRFVDVLVGNSSKSHDSRCLRRSELLKKLPGICQGDRYHLLGDAAYPLRPYLLTPYRDYGRLSKHQKEFNAKFSATRVLIENAFSTLKKRFRQLIYLELHTVPWLNKFIIACCVLHNLCIESGDIAAPDDMDDDEETSTTVEWVPENPVEDDADAAEDAALRQLGEAKRDRLMQVMLRARR